jgi:hypothetical protein
LQQPPAKIIAENCELFMDRMEGEKLTVPEILKGFLRKEFVSERVHLLELLINHFATENESELSVEKDSFRLMLRILFELIENKNNSSSSGVINLSLCVITNATVKEGYSAYLLEFINEADANDSSPASALTKKFHSIIDLFLSYNPHLEQDLEEGQEWESIDPYQHVGSILCNLCQLEEGRKILLRKSNNYMMKLPSQVRSKNPVRRRGAVGGIRRSVWNFLVSCVLKLRYFCCFSL